MQLLADQTSEKVLFPLAGTTAQAILAPIITSIDFLDSGIKGPRQPTCITIRFTEWIQIGQDTLKQMYNKGSTIKLSLSYSSL